MKTYMPEDGFQFPGYEDAHERIEQIYIPTYQKLAAVNITPTRAMRDAFDEAYRDLSPFRSGLGHEAFYRAQAGALRYCPELWDKAIKFLGRFAELSVVSSVDNTDPCVIHRICLNPPGEGAGRRAHRAHKEAMRAMIVSHQLMIMDLMDPHTGVSRDIDHLNRLAASALFDDELFPEVHVVAELEHDRLRVKGREGGSPTVHLFPKEEDAKKLMTDLRERKAAFHYKFLPVRVVRDVDGQTMYIWDTSRTKLRSSSLLKCCRKGFVNDARGMRFTVVAVVNEDGGLRTATRNDVATFVHHVKHRYWHRYGDLSLIEPSSEEELLGDDRSEVSDKNFWDIKLDGYLFVERKKGRRERRLFEQQFTSIGDAITNETVRAGDNAAFYNGRRVLKYLAKPWFGHVLDFEDPEILARIYRHWYDELPRVTFVPEDVRHHFDELREEEVRARLEKVRSQD